MIDLRELSMGNYIDFNASQLGVFYARFTGGEVTKIEKEAVWLNGVKIEPITDLVPIPLTEDWLLKLGFKVSQEDYTEYNERIWHKDGIDIHQDLSNKSFCFSTYVRSNGYLKSGYDLPSVHRLQNIYQSITGKELSL